ncbi:MAG: addiction module toxin RelE [Nanoarchaeota archaeon]
MYELEIKEEVDKIFQKLAKKNLKQLEIINKKIQEIRERPEGYKFLRNPLQGFNRVHIDSSFVLIFGIDHENKTIVICYYDHHDFIYRWRPKPE